MFRCFEWSVLSGGWATGWWLEPTSRSFHSVYEKTLLQSGQISRTDATSSSYLTAAVCLLLNWHQCYGIIKFPLHHKQKAWNYTSLYHSLVAQRLKHLPGMWETRVWSLGREDPLEKEMATHSSTLAWRIPWREERGRLQSTGSQRVGHDWATSLSLSQPRKRKWHPSPVCLPGKFHGQRSLTGYSPWGCKEWNMTKWWACPQFGIV